MSILAEHGSSGVNILHEVGHGLRAMVNVVSVWHSRHIERSDLARALPSMPDEALRDLGLTRSEARRITRRPFWQK